MTSSIAGYNFSILNIWSLFDVRSLCNTVCLLLLTLQLLALSKPGNIINWELWQSVFELHIYLSVDNTLVAVNGFDKITYSTFYI